MIKITREMFYSFEVVGGARQCPSGDYTEFEIFGERCSFGKQCSFGGISYTLFLASLGSLSDAVTVELMQRDANSHPNPKAFGEWANGGVCPYSGKYSYVERLFNFKESRELWKSGKPKMSNYDLIYAIAADKKWVLPEKITEATNGKD